MIVIGVTLATVQERPWIHVFVLMVTPVKIAIRVSDIVIVCTEIHA